MGVARFPGPKLDRFFLVKRFPFSIRFFIIYYYGRRETQFLYSTSLEQLGFFPSLLPNLVKPGIFTGLSGFPFWWLFTEVPLEFHTLLHTSGSLETQKRVDYFLRGIWLKFQVLGMWFHFSP